MQIFLNQADITNGLTATKKLTKISTQKIKNKKLY